MMKRFYTIKGEKGVALLMVMVISAIVLAVMASMVYMLTTGTRISGLGKRFATATEAAIGGHDAAMAVIGSRGDDLSLSLLDEREMNSYCLDIKLTLDTADWDPACSNTSIIDPDDPTTYDFKYKLGGYRIYSKITATVKGTSGVGGGGGGGMSGGDLMFIGTVHGGTAGAEDIQAAPMPFYYTIEIDARNILNDNERARISMLYEY